MNKNVYLKMDGSDYCDEGLLISSPEYILHEETQDLVFIYRAGLDKKRLLDGIETIKRILEEDRPIERQDKEIHDAWTHAVSGLYERFGPLLPELLERTPRGLTPYFATRKIANEIEGTAKEDADNLLLLIVDGAFDVAAKQLVLCGDAEGYEKNFTAPGLALMQAAASKIIGPGWTIAFKPFEKKVPVGAGVDDIPF